MPIESAANAASPANHGDIRFAARVFSWMLVIGFAILLWATREALAPFLFAAISIYVLLPPVRWIEQRLPGQISARHRRSIAVAITMTVFLAMLAILVRSFLSPVVEQTRQLLQSFDQYWQTIQLEYPDVTDWYVESAPTQWRVWVDEHMSNVGTEMWQGLANVIQWLLGLTDNLLSAAMAVVSIPLFLFNYMVDEQRTATNLRRQFPRIWATEGVALYRIFDSVFGTYVRGMILESVIVGVITGLGYWFIGVEMFLPLAAVAIIGEIVPIVGPWLAFFISFPVILATQPELTIPAIIVFLVVQALEGWFVSPAIQGSSNDFTNAGILVVLAIGGAVGGALGVVFALPAAALVRALSIYVFQRLNGLSSEEAIAVVEHHRNRRTHGDADTPPPPNTAVTSQAGIGGPDSRAGADSQPATGHTSP